MAQRPVRQETGGVGLRPVRVGGKSVPGRDGARRMVGHDEKARLRVRTASFEPTQDDLRMVYGYLGREIERLKRRRAEVKAMMGA